MKSRKYTWDDYWERVEKTETCWLWRGAVGADGYGHVAGRRIHRIFYAELVGPIPEGHQVQHLCNVPLCVRPDHLKTGTPKENMEYAKACGRLNGHFKPGFKPTDKMRAANSRHHKGRPKTVEQRQRMSEARKRWWERRRLMIHEETP